MKTCLFKSLCDCVTSPNLVNEITDINQTLPEFAMDISDKRWYYFIISPFFSVLKSCKCELIKPRTMLVTSRASLNLDKITEV